MTIDAVKSAVEARSLDLVDLLESFIRVPAENPPGSHLAEARSWITDRLSEYEIDWTLTPPRAPTPTTP